MAEEQINILQNNFGGMARDIFDNQLKNTKGNANARRYSDEIKQFALTLHYYSPKAYDFIRKVLHLPNPSSIRAWSASVDCSPGFLIEVMDSLKTARSEKPWMMDCVLILDAMAIRKDTVWDAENKRYAGGVDYGTAQPDSSDTLATEALVFMIAGSTGHWKHPVGYFLIDKVSA